MAISSGGKIGLGVAGLGVIGIVVAALSGVFGNLGGFQDGGIDVSGTPCNGIAAARVAVNNEFETRKQGAQTTLDATKESISDDYWAENRRLEDAHHACLSAAATADPCKASFEEIGRLYEEIMADFKADKGFNEAKFNEREQAKRAYEECVERARNDEFYTADVTQCDEALAAGRAQNQANRESRESSAQTAYESSVATAESARDAKLGVLDAIEKKCNEPGGNTNIGVGSLTTGGTGTPIQSGSSACTGVFEGNDPDLQKNLRDLENQLNKARAAGLRGGLYGIDHLTGAVNDARQQLKESERSCQTDADCGDPSPVCCSNTKVGRLFCDDGVCSAEQTECDDPKICAGTPAQCVDPSTGAQQQEGLYMERTIPEVGTCSQNLRQITLQQASPESHRFEVVGNIPNWVHFDNPGGTLPAVTNVTYDCNTVQGFGPGTYTASGSITVYNAANELINTIPVNISITVTGSEKTVEVIRISGGSYDGALIPLDQIHRFSGPECDEDEHWHANSGAAVALDGTSVPDTSDCGYGKTKDVPVISVPDTRLQIEVRGLEGLRN